MSSHTTYDHSGLAGRLSLVFAVLTLASFGWTWLISVSSFDPPEWSRIAGTTVLPFALVGAFAAGAAAYSRGDRVRGALGVGVGLVVVLAFIVLVSLYE